MSKTGASCTAFCHHTMCNLHTTAAKPQTSQQLKSQKASIIQDSLLSSPLQLLLSSPSSSALTNAPSVCNRPGPLLPSQPPLLSAQPPLLPAAASLLPEGSSIGHKTNPGCSNCTALTALAPIKLSLCLANTSSTYSTAHNTSSDRVWNFSRLETPNFPTNKNVTAHSTHKSTTICNSITPCCLASRVAWKQVEQQCI